MRMSAITWPQLTVTAVAIGVALLGGSSFVARGSLPTTINELRTTDQLAKPIEKGQRVFTTAHSFHVFVPPLLRDITKAAGIKDHVQAGVQPIGGSRVIQHWKVPDDKNQAKKALLTGQVDVLTLSPITLPDEGIDHFTKLALEHNPNIRIIVQASWMPFDNYDREFFKKRPAKVDHNAATVKHLRKVHAEHFKGLEDQVRALNKEHGKQVVFVAPVGQAVLALREKIIAGQAPGIKTQEELFIDPIGHAREPLQTLAAYCHFAVIYRRSPIGLAMPPRLEKATKGNQQLNRFLQELAWEAVLKSQESGVRSQPRKSLPG